MAIKMIRRGCVKRGILFVLVFCVCMGCSVGPNGKYAGDDFGNLAQVELYSAEDGGLVKVIKDEEILYQYHQCLNAGDFDYSEEHQEELRKRAEGLDEGYYFISYKYPVSKFGKRELEKNIIMTLYEDAKIVKMTVPEESIKGGSVPQEFLVFYYDISDEDMEFYRSLIGE